MSQKPVQQPVTRGSSSAERRGARGLGGKGDGGRPPLTPDAAAPSDSSPPARENGGGRVPWPAARRLLVCARDGGPNMSLQLQQVPVQLLRSALVEVHLEENRRRGWPDGGGAGALLRERGALTVGEAGEVAAGKGRASDPDT